MQKHLGIGSLFLSFCCFHHLPL
uniref:Uncharacterized protein n=1 Tax=Rhizophora mucronata TaxID=61149 RepID=A0A2P2PD90_RHIMU